MAKSKDDFLAMARKRFKQIADVEAEQREREREDLRFQMPEFQWNEQARRDRLSDNVNGVKTAPRPCLSIPKLQHPISIVVNQARQAELGIEVQPLSPDADEDTADIYNGIIRQMQRRSKANQARLWAFERAVEAGRGYYRIDTVYSDDEVTGPGIMDQEIRLNRILNQDSVYFDPAAQAADLSDARYCFVTSFVPVEEFKSQFPKAQVPADESFFATVDATCPEWVQGDSENGAVMVAEYFYKEARPKQLILEEGGTVARVEIKEATEYKPGEEPVKRDVEETVVHCVKMTALEVLREDELNGQYIPIVPVFGRELQAFDGKRRFIGLIHQARDAQQMYNAAASNLVEMAALEPKAPWILAEGQQEGYQGLWEQANVRNFNYLLYKPTTVGEQQAPPPQRVQADTNRMGVGQILLQQADEFIQAATSTHRATLGSLDPRDRSGKAMQALMEQGDMGNADFIYNLTAVAMEYEAKVIMDLIPKIYDRPGRVVRILDPEDETSKVILGQPFLESLEKKNPIPVQEMLMPPAGPGMPPTRVPAIESPGGQGMLPVKPEDTERIKEYDLSKGVFGVTVKVGKAYQSRLQEGSEEIGKLLEKRPELLPIIGPMYFKFRDFPGAQQIADDLGKMRDTQHPELRDPDAGPTPQQLQGELQQMQQQAQASQQQIQSLTFMLEANQARQEATMHKTNTDAQVAQMRQESDAQLKVMLEQMKEQHETTLEQMKQAFEARQAQQDRTHETARQDDAQAHEVGVTAQKAAQPQIKPIPPRGNDGA